MATKFPPFSKDSDGYKKMCELLDDGTIDPYMQPKLAYRQDPVFRNYKPDAFRAGLNKEKAKQNMMMRDPQEGECSFV